MNPLSVAVRATDPVTEDVLAWMERANRPDNGHPPPRIVLITDRIDPGQCRRAVGAGLVSLLRRRDCGSARIVAAVTAAGTGTSAAVPDPPVDDVPPAPPGGREATGFDTRELDVLRLLADGWETAEVAVRLNYSERSVKNIIHGVLVRHGLRNRTQAVAYALRSGVL